MRALCVSDHPCSYRTDTGYCGYIGNGCALYDTATVKAKNTPTYRITQLVDISPESIEEIANAVVKKLREEEVKHGHWEVAIGYDLKKSRQCSECRLMAYEPTEYCPHCGAKMDEVTE